MSSGIIRFDEGRRFDAGHHFDQPPNLPPPTPAPVLPVKRRTGVTTMDYIPTKRAERYLWWKKIRDSIETEGPKFALAPADVTAAKAVATNQCLKMEATDDAETALDGARATEKSVTTTNTAAIRGYVRNWKTLSGYPASGSEGVLGLKGSESTFDPSSFKSVIKLSLDGNQIKLEFTKAGVDAVVVYSRLRGSLGWTKLGTDSASPYYDTRPLGQPGVAEVREYMVRGLLDDEEVGLDSDIGSIAFGG
jgi:hypothetical protein